MCAVVFAPASYAAFAENPRSFEHQKPFDETDLEAIGERIKHMNIVAAAQVRKIENLRGFFVDFNRLIGSFVEKQNVGKNN